MKNQEKINEIYTNFFNQFAECVEYLPHVKLKIPNGLKEPFKSMTWQERKSFFYKKIDELNKELEPFTLCDQTCMKNENGGCVSNRCCTMYPDLFGEEPDVIDSLPRVNNDPEYCHFLNLEKGICSIYEHRPFACRVFLNFDNNEEGCLDNPMIKSNKRVLFIYAREFLGDLSGTLI